MSTNDYTVAVGKIKEGSIILPAQDVFFFRPNDNIIRLTVGTFPCYFEVEMPISTLTDAVDTLHVAGVAADRDTLLEAADEMFGDDSVVDETGLSEQLDDEIPF